MAQDPQDPHDPRRDPRRDQRRMGLYLALAQVGLEMVAPIVIGVVVDVNYGWAPWGIVAGAVLGLVGGLAHMVAILKRLNERDK